MKLSIYNKTLHLSSNSHLQIEHGVAASFSVSLSVNLWNPDLPLNKIPSTVDRIKFGEHYNSNLPLH